MAYSNCSPIHGGIFAGHGWKTICNYVHNSETLRELKESGNVLEKILYSSPAVGGTELLLGITLTSIVLYGAWPRDRGI